MSPIRGAMVIWNPVHEYAHGISTRLTGGPGNSNCLGWDEAGGMGEGWGDFFATIFRMNSTFDRTKDFGMGEWANGEGIRKYLYSTSLKTNPSTYSYLDKPGYWGVHAKGEVWAEILYEVYWNLVDKHGFTANWFPPTDNHPASLAEWYFSEYVKTPRHGNTLALQLIVDGMKLQPCRPTFIDARDAIIQADELLTNGDNLCDIWQAFAKRGLGIDAKIIGGGPWGGGTRVESFSVPEDCFYFKCLYNSTMIKTLSKLLNFLEHTRRWVALVASIVLVYARDIHVAYIIAGGIVMGFIAKVLKYIIRQPRPKDKSYGMPSSHSAITIYYALSISFQLFSSPLPYLINLLLSTIALGIAISVVWSRIALGYHTHMQVIVGVSMGFAFALTWNAWWNELNPTFIKLNLNGKLGWNELKTLMKLSERFIENGFRFDIIMES
ncbi:15206_t:CDS:2 [Acaulospora morrowiae]|uniref:Extracellular metalloproteinase n=1 Tax=Acaulospora morrowiae TaxID=94023 RepID=A0A9N9HY84_9GLOM|nr:15206_t:CDS:2 [Acaulospora morrowiae]